MVRAKFRVESKEPNGEGFDIRLAPVISGSAENENFYRLTPGGEIRLTTINVAAADEFEVGKEYYVDFGLAE